MGSTNKKDIKAINQNFNKKSDDKNSKNKNTVNTPFKVTGNKANAEPPKKTLNPGALAAKKLAGTKTVPAASAPKPAVNKPGSKTSAITAAAKDHKKNDFAGVKQPVKEKTAVTSHIEKKAEQVKNTEINDELLFRLFKEAKSASENAYAPYSKFKVGAVLLIESESNAGQLSIYTGCNVENASFSMTCCAERIAIFKAISDGNYKFKAMFLYATADKPVSPCGACRQVISEFADSNMKIYSIGKFDDKNLAKTPYKVFTVGELLPYQFKATDFVK